jgi:hypothetical protein
MNHISNNINTKEEKAISKIITILSDLALDIERMGYIAGVNMPYIIYERFIEVAESTEYNRTKQQEFNTKGNFYYDINR